MNILGFDTSHKAMTIALRTGNEFMVTVREAGLRHSELLLQEIDSLLTAAKLTIRDLDLLVCGKGPGSFTGIRIGLSTVKGLSAAYSTPFVTVSILDCYADIFSFWPGTVAVVLDARKNKLYGCLYKNNVKISDYFDISVEQLFENSFDFPLLITGPDSTLLHEYANENIRIDEYGLSRNTGKSLLNIGAKQFNVSGSDPDDSYPLYIRKSDAEIMLKKR